MECRESGSAGDEGVKRVDPAERVCCVLFLYGTFSVNVCMCVYGYVGGCVLYVCVVMYVWVCVFMCMWCKCVECISLPTRRVENQQ